MVGWGHTGPAKSIAIDDSVVQVSVLWGIVDTILIVLDCSQNSRTTDDLCGLARCLQGSESTFEYRVGKVRSDCQSEKVGYFHRT